VELTPVTHGLVCRVTPGGEAPIDKWVEVVPLLPSRYFEYTGNWEGNRLSYRATIIDANRDGQPDLPPGEEPIDLSIRGDGVIYPAVPVSPTKFTGAQRSVVLDTMPLPGLRGTKIVGMDVDGVPRAVSWSVDIDNRLANPTRSYANVQLLRVAMPAGETPARLYRRSRVDYPDPNPDEWPPPTVMDIRSDGICAFNVSRGLRPDLKIQLQIDAPADSFEAVADGSVVTLEWVNVAAPPYHFPAPRLITTDLAPINEAGELIFVSSVGEVTLTLPAPAVDDKVVTLTATLSAQRPEPLQRTDSLMIAFDRSPPTIGPVVVKTPSIVVGTANVDLDLTITDLSTIETVEYWYSDEPLRSVDELPPKDVIKAFESEKSRPYEVEERTRTVTLAAPTEVKRQYITLRVTDRSGQSATTLGRRLVVDVREPAAPPPPPTTGTLRGQVVYTSKPGTAGLTVTATAPDESAFTATTRAEGFFEIPNLPFGAYKLTVSGTVERTNFQAKGEAPAPVPDLAAFKRLFKIPATMDMAPNPPKN
jgi:hypothetical protein